MILTLVMASEAARIVEEIVLREGHQKNRQQRRFEDRNNQVIQQQEVEILHHCLNEHTAFNLNNMSQNSFLNV